jgi:hypothetical protein
MSNYGRPATVRAATGATGSPMAAASVIPSASFSVVCGKRAMGGVTRGQDAQRTGGAGTGPRPTQAVIVGSLTMPVEKG